MSKAPYVIGVEGGGTKTLGLLMGAGEEILARGTEAASNIHSNPHELVRERLHNLFHSLCEQGGITTKQIDAVCLGMAGCDSPGDRQVLEGFIRPLLSDKARFTVVNDAIPAVRAIIGRLHGILLIAGTGSICYGFNERTGQQARAGGWGYLLSDEGSGYRIGLGALKAILAAVDHRGPKTIMHEPILAHLGKTEPRGIVNWIYSPEGNKTNVAALSRFVFEADAKGDLAAASILDFEAEELASLIPVVFHRLYTKEDGRVPLGVWGGNLVHGDRYRERFLRHVKETGLPLEVVLREDADATLGAARHAASML
jgi:N-acetylglucosamine kinase-like BadF-type ATPase